MLASESLEPVKMLGPNSSLRSRRRLKTGLLVFGVLTFLMVYWHRNSALSSFWSIVNTPTTGFGRQRNATWDARANEVKKSFKRAYARYHELAFPDDELRPLGNRSINNFNGWGVTAIDSIDTMILMDLSEEYEAVRQHVMTLNFAASAEGTIPFFETVIRYVGGFLSAYGLTKDRLFLSAADDIARELLVAFNTPSHLPAFGVQLGANPHPVEGWNAGRLILAEIGSFQLEYKSLAHLTQRPSYFTKAEFVSKHLGTYQKPSGLWGVWWEETSGTPVRPQFTMGSQADSTYEYLLKGWLLSGRTETYLLDMHMDAIRGAIAELVFLSRSRHLMYMTEVDEGRPTGSMQHLTCFFPGLLALSNYLLPDSVYLPGEKQILEWAAEGLANTCYILYAESMTGLGPEEVKFFAYNGDDDYEAGKWIKHVQKWGKKVSWRDGKPPGLQDPVPRYQGDEQSRDYEYNNPTWYLRPETLESMYLMWKTTGNPIWRERAWEIFQAIEKHAKVNGASYATVLHVDQPVAMHADDQPSYFFAETLKYLYLTFTEDDPWPLDQFVFNTEAHPLRVFDWTVSERQRFGMTE